MQRGVVAVVPRGNQLLVIRRSQYVRAPGAFCFPGGAVEEGEAESEALCREMREELGCDVVPLERLWRSVTAWQVALSWWLAELPPNAVLLPNPAEVESIHWLTVEELWELPQLLSSNRDFLVRWQERRNSAMRGEFGTVD
jgi:8-oxo-dGTP diphosphatase